MYLYHVICILSFIKVKYDKKKISKTFILFDVMSEEIVNRQNIFVKLGNIP